MGGATPGPAGGFLSVALSLSSSPHPLPPCRPPEPPGSWGPPGRRAGGPLAAIRLFLPRCRRLRSVVRSAQRVPRSGPRERLGLAPVLGIQTDPSGPDGEGQAAESKGRAGRSRRPVRGPRARQREARQRGGRTRPRKPRGTGPGGHSRTGPPPPAAPPHPPCCAVGLAGTRGSPQPDTSVSGPPVPAAGAPASASDPCSPGRCAPPPGYVHGCLAGSLGPAPSHDGETEGALRPR